MVWVKRLGLLLVALIALIIAAVIYVVVFVDPNQFKGELQELAKEKANVTLRMDGDIDWSIYPRIGLSLENFGIALANDPELVSFSKAEFGVQLMPLFQQRIEVDSVRLENLTANLKVDKDGNPNWQVETAGDATSATQNDNKSSNESFTIPDITLDELALVNAHVIYEDQRTGMRSDVVSNVTFTNVRLDEAWPMQMDAVVTQSNLDGSNAITANVDFAANFTLFAERQSVSFANVELNARVAGDNLPASPLDATLNVVQLDFDLPQENASLEGLKINTLGMDITGQVNAYQVLSAPEFDAVLDMAEFSPKSVLSQLNIELPEMADDNVLEKASMSITAQGSMDSIKAQPISINVDDTTIEANALLNLSPLNWDIAIAGANLDLDRYLPPVKDAETASEDSTEVPAGQGTTTSEQELIPVDLVRSLNGHVGIAFDNIKVKNLQLDKIELDTTQTNGKVNISPAQVHLYDGVAQLKAQLDVTGKTPEMAVTPSIESVEILPLLKDFMALEKVRGATNLTGDLSTHGNRIEELISNLNGDLLVNITDGALLGTNYTKMVCKGIALARTETLDESAFKEDTPFETMRIPAKIVNGEVSTPGLRMQSLTLGVTGNGVISLPSNSLDYETRVALVGSGLDESCAVNKDVANIEFPIVCKGDFMDDAASLCRPDVKGFISAIAGKEIAEAKAAAKVKLDAEKARAKEKLDAEKARLDEKKDEAKQELEDKLKSKLKDLF
ncbi:AsmA family protein [Marinomonas atlantica]|uniref:AsmA family protein n=1 Tax=Marinomonas atlantica TaxID=1806668 RepID=UPI00082C3C89|nr:AsmA family protein [Marinomonas atlantica]